MLSSVRRGSFATYFSAVSLLAQNVQKNAYVNPIFWRFPSLFSPKNANLVRTLLIYKPSHIIRNLLANELFSCIICRYISSESIYIYQYLAVRFALRNSMRISIKITFLISTAFLIGISILSGEVTST